MNIANPESIPVNVEDVPVLEDVTNKVENVRGEVLEHAKNQEQ